MMREMYDSFVAWVGKTKFRISRGYGYFSVLGIGFLVVDRLKEYKYFGQLHVIWLFCLGMFAVWLLGYIDDKYHFYGAEAGYSWVRNPEYHKIKKEEPK